MEIGDKVKFPLGTDARIYGVIDSIGHTAINIREVYATHQLWGYSNGAMGTLHRVERQELIEPVTDYESLELYPPS